MLLWDWKKGLVGPIIPVRLIIHYSNMLKLQKGLVLLVEYGQSLIHYSSLLRCQKGLVGPVDNSFGEIIIHSSS